MTDRRNTSWAYDTEINNAREQITDTYGQNHIYYLNRGKKIQAYLEFKATLIIFVTP